MQKLGQIKDLDRTEKDIVGTKIELEVLSTYNTRQKSDIFVASIEPNCMPL